MFIYFVPLLKYQLCLAVQYLTQFLLAEHRYGGVGSAQADGVLGTHSEAVGLSLLQLGHMSLWDADHLKLIPLSLPFLLVLHQEACDVTSSVAVGPVPLQPHLSLVDVHMVEVLRRARGDCRQTDQLG